MSEPIPVTERLPEVGDRVLWCGNDGDWEIGTFGRFNNTVHDGHFQWDEGEGYYTPDDDGGLVQIKYCSTHWMPLPPPAPKVELPPRPPYVEPASREPPDLTYGKIVAVTREALNDDFWHLGPPIMEEAP